MPMIERRLLCLGLVASIAVSAAPRPGRAASAGEIDAGVEAALRRFYRRVEAGPGLVERAAAVLVFPRVLKAGMGIGGEYGEGALLIGGGTVAYYNTVSASIGFQLGAQARSIIILFMTPEALASFRRVDGWKVGVDGSVAIITVSAAGSFDTNLHPVVGFILDAKGLMYNLTLEGSKITRIERD
jgi:lipid-binding SYLF domain-containing protein